jgi:two-component system response regulator WspF
MRVAIVNDVPMAVEGLRRVVQSTGLHQVAWIAWNGLEAIDLCQRDRPDLILMDLHMPMMDGVIATKKIMENTPCPILIVTASVNQNTAMVFQAMGNGALDAVNTPILSGAGSENEQLALLKKISLLNILSQSPLPKHIDRQSSASQHGEAEEQKKIVVIGSSSGGPQALATILKSLPHDYGAGIVIVQHVDSQFAKGLADWLDDQTGLTVRLAREGDRPSAGVVLIAGSDNHLVMTENGELNYQQDPEDIPYRPSIDVFWRTIDAFWKGPVAAVLLTGMGKDGAQAMLDLKKSGAYTIAQNEKTCAVYGMPKAAVDLNAVIDVRPIEEIASALLTFQGSDNKAKFDQG